MNIEDNNCKLSIVIPTHNRAQYAGPAIDAILSYNHSDFELVVSDTSTDGELGSFLNTRTDLKNDRRLIFERVDSPSNLNKNHNYAMSLARGKYVCLIGDDDSVSSSLFDAVDWADQHNIDIVSHAILANYAWPDFQAKLTGKGHASRLYLPRSVGPPQWRNAKADLGIALARGLQGTENLPRCYHGLVRRDLLQKIKETTGDYFHGSSPDMSGAVSLGGLVDTYIEVDIPLTLPGASAGSNSGRSAMNTHKGPMHAETQTREFTDKGWASGVPQFFSVETVWAHAGLRSLSAVAPDMVVNFNFPRLLAYCYVRHPEFSTEISKATVEAAKLLSLTPDEMENRITHQVRSVRWTRYKYLARRGLWPTAAGGRKYIGKQKDIKAAQLQLNAYIKAETVPFRTYMQSLRA